MIVLFIIFLMVAFNGALAAYEIALASATLGRLRLLKEQGKPGAAAAVWMKEKMEASLAAVQIGITLVGAIAAATGGAGADESLTPLIQSRLGVSEAAADAISIVALVIPLTIVTILFGELAPKVFALRNREAVCLGLSPAMRIFCLSVWPAVRFFEGSVRLLMLAAERAHPTGGADARQDEAHLQEISATAALARAAMLIGDREERIIVGAARLRSRSVREIMLPIEDVHLLAADQNIADALIRAHMDMHTRYPVTEREGDPQAINGYVNFKDIVAALRVSPGDPTMKGLLRPILSFGERATISDCLEGMMRDRAHIALVRSNDGAVVGMVSIEDIIEELVGDIEDEHDRLPSYLHATSAGWMAGGGITIERLSAAGVNGFAAKGSAKRLLADWVAQRLDRDPRGGDEFEENGLRIAVRKVRRGRAVEVQITPSARAAAK